MPSVNSDPRVLFVATTEGEGGIERYSVRLGAALRAQGIPVTYACRPGGFVEVRCTANGIPTLPWRVRNSGDVGAALSLSRLLHVQQIEIVHVHSRRDYVPALLGAVLARRRRPGLRLLLHTHLIRALGEPPRLAGRFFRWGADGVIAVSEAVRARLIAEHSLPPEFIHLLPNGVDTVSFATPNDPWTREWRRAQRRRWGIPDDALVVGMMGRLDAKGQDRLLRVAPEIVQKFPTTRFVLAGPEGKPGDRERLLEQARALSLAGHLVLPGMTEDVPSTMAGFDVLAHLPADESFGLALVEAMAAGLPTVATDIGGCREVVLDGVTGTLVPLGDPEALLSSLGCLLDPLAGRERRKRLGEAGRLRAVSTYSLERQGERLTELYRSLQPSR